jgi:CubicO group peptidase (beta-lactamase class C family)
VGVQPAVDVRGRVIEAVTGKRAGDFLAERIFKPLGMKDTGFFVPQAEQARLAEAFETDPVSGNKHPSSMLANSLATIPVVLVASQLRLTTCALYRCC